MFGSIGTFNAAGSKFNHAAGDQYNTNVAPTPGMAGPMDPQFRQYFATSVSTSPAPRTKMPMFGAIDHFNADGSLFNNAAGDQYNYASTHSGVVSPASIVHPLATQTFPSPKDPSTQLPETTASSAEARMFGRINHFRAENSEYNNSMGNQVNIHRAPGTPFPNLSTGPSLDIKITPPRRHNLFSSNTQTQTQTQTQTATASSSDSDGSTFVHTALGVTDFVLSTLQTAAKFSTVPFLAQAAGASLTILQAVQVSRDNKDGFARLAGHACNLISSVVVVQQERERQGRQLAPHLISNLRDLLQKLQPIEAFVLKQNERHGLKRLVMYKADVAKVAEHREKLMHALDEFGLRSNINVEDGVAQIDKRLEDLVAALQIADANGSSRFNVA